MHKLLAILLEIEEKLWQNTNVACDVGVNLEFSAFDVAFLFFTRSLDPQTLNLL